MAQSERNSHSINRGVGKNKMTLRYLYQENISQAERAAISQKAATQLPELN